METRRLATAREMVRERMTDGDADVDSKANNLIIKFK